MPPTPLQTRIAQALPPSLQLLIHHIVSEPSSCPELFPAPPNEAPEPTTCESHFLTASILYNSAPLQVFALEVLVYTTKTLTTIFVSKADSTGYLHLLQAPKGSPSPIKAVITSFLDHLVGKKRRKDARLVLSLFARAQNQYLFPGSIENSEKHVLDDRGLIRWWCRIIDPIVGRYFQPESSASYLLADEPKAGATYNDFTARAHLVIPNCDIYETRAFFPQNLQSPGNRSLRWAAKDPLQSLGKPTGLPPRCYIPRFPDDPKARFVIDLDNELSATEPSNSDDLLKGQLNGQWRSVRSIAQFWEFMAFRQECAAGRLVGFIWAVFEPLHLNVEPLKPTASSSVDIQEQNEDSQLPTPNDSQNRATATPTPELPPSPALQPLPDTVLSPLPSSQPEPGGKHPIEDQTSDPRQEAAAGLPLPEAVFTSRKTEDGLILGKAAFKRVVLLLETLDYASLDIALESTRSFFDAASKEVLLEDPFWGFEVVGEKSAQPLSVESSSSIAAGNSNDAAFKANQKVDAQSLDQVPRQANMLGGNLVRKKKRLAEEPIDQVTEADQSKSEPRMLGSGLIRKKPKV